MRTIVVFAALAFAALWVVSGLSESEQLFWRVTQLVSKRQQPTQAKKEKQEKVSLDPADPKLELQLEQMMKAFGVEYGGVTVLDVPTGQVVAAAGSSRRAAVIPDGWLRALHLQHSRATQHTRTVRE